MNNKIQNDELFASTPQNNRFKNILFKLTVAWFREGNINKL